MQILKAPEPVVAKKGAVKTAPKKKWLFNLILYLY